MEAKSEAGELGESAQPIQEEANYEALFVAVYQAKDGNREICEMFKLLPSKQVSTHLITGKLQYPTVIVHIVNYVPAPGHGN